MESLNKEIKRNISDEGYNTAENYPIRIKPYFSTSRSFTEIERVNYWQLSFVQHGILRERLEIKPSVVHE